MLTRYEITVSVEFKPAGKLTQDYKPDLKVFSMGKGSVSSQVHAHSCGQLSTEHVLQRRAYRGQSVLRQSFAKTGEWKNRFEQQSK